MINKTFICSFNKNGVCTFPGASPSTGPDGIFDITDGGCRAKLCSGYTPPHKNKIATPISRVSVCHTPLTVPSIGASISYFVRDINGTKTTQFPIGTQEAVTNLISEWYENGDYPPMLYLRRQNGDKWGCDISGKFMGQATGTHNFYLLGDGYSSYRIATIPADSVLATGTFNFTKDSVSPLFASVSLNSGQWYKFDIRYEQAKLNEGGYTVLVDYPGSISKLPLSAGMYCSSNTEAIDGELPLTYFTIPFVKDVKIQEAQKEGTTFTFSVPIVISGYGGYSYDNINDYFYCNVSGMGTSYLKKGELIKLEMGFVQNDHQDYVTKFVGNIDDFSISFGSEGEKILNVNCLDFINITNDTINKNYPSFQTYWLAGLIDNNTQSTGYKIGTPAFDSWYVGDVIRALLIHGGIDSTLLNHRYEFLNRAGETVLGTEYLMYATSGTNIFPSIRLERPTQYGGFDSEQYGAQPDGEYFFKYGFGEKITDIIDELSDNFGFQWGFRGYNNGAPYIRTINTPSKYYLANNFTFSGNWPGDSSQGDAFNINSVGGLYASTEYSGSMASINFTGTSLSLVCPVANIGSGYHINAKLNRVSDNVQLTNVNINLDNNDEWHFYDGIYSPIGYNPTVIKIVSGLPYDAYKLTLESLQTSVGPQMFNAVFIYEKDYETPEDVFNVIKYGDYQGNVISYNYNDSAADNRNDIIVIGKSKGIESRASEFNEKKYYYIGRGMDLRSIYDPTAFNYVGKYKSGILVNNRITSDERASFIAFSILDRLRNKGKKIDIEIQGNPLIEQNDCFTIIDDYHQTVSGTRWVESVSTALSTNVLKTNINCFDFKPYGSFISKPDVNISGSLYVYKDGIQILNRGTIRQIKSVTYSGSSPQDVDIEFQPFIDKFGNAIQNLEDCVPFSYASYPVPTQTTKFVNCYRLIDGKENILVALDSYKDINNNMIGIKTNASSVGTVYESKFNVNENILIPYDPYSSEKGQETFVTIKFQVLKKAKVKVEIIDQKSNLVVATLTGNPSLSHPEDKLWESMDVGEHVLYWAGFDQYGEYNKTCPSYHYSMMPNFVTDPHRQTKGTPEAGMYVSESFIESNQFGDPMPQYGRFYVRFIFSDIVTNDTETYDATDQPIFTRRGWGLFSSDLNPLINVLYSNARHKHWSGSLKKYKFDNISDTGEDNGIEFYHSIIDTDNNNRGIGVTIHSYYRPELSFRKPFYVPRTLKYVIRAQYQRISALTVYDRREGNNDEKLAIYGDISDGPSKIESSIIQLPYNSTIVSQGDYGGDPIRGNVYFTNYFSPSRDDKLSFRTHAGGLMQGLEQRSGYEFFAWLVGLYVEVQDLSGRNIQWTDYFQWFGQNISAPYEMMGDIHTGTGSSNSPFMLYHPNSYAPEDLYEIYPTRLYCLDWRSSVLDPENSFVLIAGTPKDILGDFGKYWLEKERLVKEKRDITRWYEAGKVNAQVFRI